MSGSRRVAKFVDGMNICEVCGKPFEGRSVVHRLCSPECRKKYVKMCRRPSRKRIGTDSNGSTVFDGDILVDKTGAQVKAVFIPVVMWQDVDGKDCVVPFDTFKGLSTLLLKETPDEND